LNPLRIGTRGSALARWQAESVRARLAQLSVPAELVLIRTSGDRDAKTPLHAMAGKGIFIKELEDALLDGRIDLAVHSMKDVPTELPAGLGIAAICERQDVRDALVSRDGQGLTGLPAGALVGTSSLRRQAQLLNQRPDLRMVEMRGNVDTRLAKVARGDCDAIVLAKAGLERLGFTQRIKEVLTPDVFIPAAGQGAIGVETRLDDNAVNQAVRQLDHVDSRIAVEAERAVLAGLEGGCSLPLGVWARASDREFIIDACVLAADGSEALRVRRAGAPRDAAELAPEVAAALRESGAERLLRAAGRAT
jgi:hydroxymethylbilane synthase